MSDASSVGNGHRLQPKKARRFTDADAAKFLKRGYGDLKARQLEDAGACCRLVLKYKPRAKEAHFLVGLIALENKNWSTAKKAFGAVVEIDETHAAGWAQGARVYVLMGQYALADKALQKAVALMPEDPLVQDVIGTVFSLLGDQDLALKWYDKACAGSFVAAFELSRAKALTFLGDFDQAKTSLKSVIKATPKNAQAHWLLSRVDKAEDTEHLEQMDVLIRAEASDSPALPYLYYAKGKENEDLENWSEAFAAFEAGAKARRCEVTFDRQAEADMFNAFEGNFTNDWLTKAGAGSDDPSPIFIIGQPRTGTTLVERIITAHSDVQSAGELQQFGMALKRLLGATSSGPLTPELVAKAAREIVPQQLAQLYLETTRSVRPKTPQFIDKLPVNYLYTPLIAAAFPKAKIIHLVRGALDSCVASYKQLFAEAYYHSYDQLELAEHHVRYRRLMAHWRDLLGDRMLDVDYENTVENFEPNARKIIDFLGLEWQDAVREFHNQKAAVTTASAAQVREKAHGRSVGRWRKYDEYLGPMKTTLSDAGL